MKEPEEEMYPDEIDGVPIGSYEEWQKILEAHNKEYDEKMAARKAVRDTLESVELAGEEIIREIPDGLEHLPY